MKLLPLVALCVLLVAIGASIGCQTHLGKDAPVALPPTGQQVTVQFRRDILGARSNSPVPPNTNSVDGARVSLSGRLLEVNAEWVVVEIEKREHWIPRSVVLLIQVQ